MYKPDTSQKTGSASSGEFSILVMLWNSRCYRRRRLACPREGRVSRHPLQPQGVDARMLANDCRDYERLLAYRSVLTLPLH